jgi:tryptophanyl-tRNA synthetase
MSKSYGNSILLSDWPGDVMDKMSRMTNGGQREPQSQPGNPDACPVGDMHALFSEPMIDDHIRAGCRSAEIACIQCKSMAASSINLHLHPIRKRRKKLEADPAGLWSALEEGARGAASRAEMTMGQVRAVMGLGRSLPVLGGAEKRAYSTYEASREGHDLSEYASWWDLEQKLRARNLRDHWRYRIVPREVRLTQDSDRVFITWKKKRVYATTSREDIPGSWAFEAKPKSYEMLALLCWDKEFRLRDFIVPQIVYQVPWTAYKRSHKNEDLVFWVRRSEGSYFLELPGALPMDITEYLGVYGPMN